MLENLLGSIELCCVHVAFKIGFDVCFLSIMLVGADELDPYLFKVSKSKPGRYHAALAEISKIIDSDLVLTNC